MTARITVWIGTRPGLNLKQNKHVLRALRGKESPQRFGNKAIYFISQILGSKHARTPKKCMKNEIKH